MICRFNVSASLRPSSTGASWAIDCPRWERFRAPIIKALLDRQNVDPVSLNGKRVLIKTSKSLDSKGVERLYFLVFARSETLEKIEGLPTYSIVARDGKVTGYGAWARLQALTPHAGHIRLSSRTGGHWIDIIFGVNINAEYIHHGKETVVKKEVISVEAVSGAGRGEGAPTPRRKAGENQKETV